MAAVYSRSTIDAFDGGTIREIPNFFCNFVHGCIPPGRIVIEGVMLWESFSYVVVNTFTARDGNSIRMHASDMGALIRNTLKMCFVCKRLI